MTFLTIQEAHVYEFDNSQSLTITAPTAGNLLAIWAYANAASDQMASTGFAEWPGSPITSGSQKGRWLYKFATGSEGTTLTCTSSDGTSQGFQFYEVSSDAGFSLVDGVAALSATAGPITVDDAAILLVGFGHTGLSGATVTYSNSFTNVVNANLRIQSGERVAVGAGAYSTVITANNVLGGSIVAVNPAAAATTVPHRGFPRSMTRGLRR